MVYSSSESSSSPEARAVRADFSSFLSSRLERQGVVEVSRQIKTLTDRIQQELRQGEEVGDIANAVQEFYSNFGRHLQNSPVFKGEGSFLAWFRTFLMRLITGLSDAERDQTVEWCEKYALVCSYKDLFCPANSSDEEKDLQLQSRIRRLSWITTKHLGCVITESSQGVRDKLHDAITRKWILSCGNVSNCNSFLCHFRTAGDRLQAVPPRQADHPGLLLQEHLRDAQDLQPRGRLRGRVPALPHLRLPQVQPAQDAVQHQLHHQVQERGEAQDGGGWILLRQSRKISSFTFIDAKK